MKIARRRLFGLVAAVVAVGAVKPVPAQAAPVKALATGGLIESPYAVPASGLNLWPEIGRSEAISRATTVNSAGHYIGDGQAVHSLPVPPNTKTLMLSVSVDTSEAEAALAGLEQQAEALSLKIGQDTARLAQMASRDLEDLVVRAYRGAEQRGRLWAMGDDARWSTAPLWDA